MIKRQIENLGDEYEIKWQGLVTVIEELNTA